MRKSIWFIALISMILLVASGCSLRRIAVNQMADMMETGLGAYESDDDLYMLEKAFPGNIKLLEAMLANEPDSMPVRLLLSRLYGSYAFAFIETRLEILTHGAPVAAGILPLPVTADENTLRRKAASYYQTGVDYALDVLEDRHPDCRQQLADNRSRSAFLDRMTVEDVPALFWYGFNLGAWVNLNRDNIRALGKAHLAVAAMEKVIALDETYYHGGGHLFLTTYYASRSSMMGGNPTSARKHFSRLKEIVGDDFLLADLVYARYYLYQIQDRNRFESVLNNVAGHPSPPGPYRLMNRIAAIRARAYLAAADDLFP